MKYLGELLGGEVENRILPFFWQHGEDAATLRKYMQVIHDANIGAVCVESRPHPDYVGPKWWADMDVILEEAECLGMQVWILDDSHFPTGYANGALDDGPDELCRASIDRQTVTVPAVPPDVERPGGACDVREGTAVAETTSKGDAEIRIPVEQLRQAAPWQPTRLESAMLRKDNPYMRSFTEPDALLSVAAIRIGGRGSGDVVDLTGEAREALAKGEDLQVRLPAFSDSAEGPGLPGDSSVISDMSDISDSAAGPQRQEGAGERAAWTIEIIHRTHHRGPHRNYINMMLAPSVKLLIDTVYEPHWEHYRRYFGNTLAGFFSDEPELGNGHLYEFGHKIGEGTDQAWSPEVEAELKKRWGDAFAANLPFIWNQDFEKDCQAKIRFDYMDVVTRCVEKDFSFQLGDWCRSHGVMYIGHLIEDDHQHSRTQSSLGHYFRGLAGEDMAGVDDIGGQIMPQGEAVGPGNFLHPVRDGEFWHYTLGKLAGSAAAIDPRKKGRAMCELFGAYGWSEGVRLEKYIADHLLASGINWFVPHAFSAAPFPDPDCPPHFYAHGNNPQYRHFGSLCRYLNRCANLLSDGRAIVPTAILYNAEADWAGEIMYLQKPAMALWDHQIDYYFIPNDALTGADPYTAWQTSIGRELQIGQAVYRCLIVPEMEYIPRAAAKAAAEMARAGGLVVFAGGLPRGTIEGGSADPLIAELAALSEQRVIRIAALEDLTEMLRQSGISDARIAPESDRIRIYHYRRMLTEGRESELYMIINEAAEAWDGEICIPAHQAVSSDTTHHDPAAGHDAPRAAAFYDAWENRLTDAAARQTADGVGVRLHLDPSKSVFLILDSAPDAARTQDGDGLSAEIAPAGSNLHLIAMPPAGLTESDWSEGWLRSTCSSLAYPAFEEPRPIALPDSLAEEQPTFSGFVRYDKTLRAEAGQKTILTISDAQEGVEVFVNGESLGIQIVPEYRYDLTTHLRTGDNEIRIEVATTLERLASTFPNPYAGIMEQPAPTSASGISGKVKLSTAP